MASVADAPVTPAAHQVPEGWRSQAAVFDDIFLVFVLLGTIVGVVVIGYMLWNAYQYREAATPSEEFDGPTVGELPMGGTGGKKLFLSFAISAIIVISLVAWTYMALLYVEAGATEQVEPEFEIDVQGVQFGWNFEYPNNHTEFGEMRIPADTVVGLNVTSADVWHTFGAPELRVKADAIPGQTSESWVIAQEEGQYRVQCFELCGVGHSTMNGEINVTSEEEFQNWYNSTQEEDEE